MHRQQQPKLLPKLPPPHHQNNRPNRIIPNHTPNPNLNLLTNPKHPHLLKLTLYPILPRTYNFNIKILNIKLIIVGYMDKYFNYVWILELCYHSDLETFSFEEQLFWFEA